MTARRVVAALLCALAFCLAGARPEARSDRDRDSADSAAIRELLEGRNGRRVAWAAAPALVIVSSVMDYTGNDMSAGYVAVDEAMTPDDVAGLTADLTRALDELTGGAFKAFRTVSVESPAPGARVQVVRPGQIVVGRFRDVQARTGSLGYGGRLTCDTTIVGAVVVLDAAFDRQSSRHDLLRTHELGHALGYNHVESRPSVRNPRVGSAITEFDRAAIRLAFPEANGQP